MREAHDAETEKCDFCHIVYSLMVEIVDEDLAARVAPTAMRMMRSDARALTAQVTRV